MIVKNEADNLPRCLNDIRPIVDEIVVVDTGSTDRTVEIARRYGARVYHYDWTDDFSAARNESLRNAIGDYVLWLDADDRISSEAKRKLISLKDELTSAPSQAYALLIDCKDHLGQSACYYQVRIFPNHKNIRFEGRVHEQVQPSLRIKKIQVVQKDIEIEHIGYNRPDESVRKAERNLKILLGAEKESGLDTSGYYQVARCYFGLKNYRQCIYYIEKAKGMAHDPFLDKSAYSLLADSYLQIGESGKAVRFLSRALERHPSSGYINYLLGATLAISGSYQEALLYLKAAIRTGVEIEGFAVLTNIDARITYYCGKCFEGIGKLDEARIAYETAIEHTPHDADLLQSYGMLLIKLGKLDKAVDVLERKREADPFLNRVTLHTLSKLYLFMKKPARSQKLYRQIVDKYPEDIDALVGLLTASCQTGQHDLFNHALKMMGKCFRIDSFPDINSLEDAIFLLTDIVGKLEASGDKSNIPALTAVRGSLESRMHSA